MLSKLCTSSLLFLNLYHGCARYVGAQGVMLSYEIEREQHEL